jgi:DNA adenine methylase
MSKSFIKWVGGKSRILKDLIVHFPTKYKTYYEPFLGGGSVFFALKPKKAVLADSNAELINAFKIVKEKPGELIDLLSAYTNDLDFYAFMRGLEPLSLDRVTRAARFIFLNKTGFNGLYRVNSKNAFNVPFGNREKPRICDEPAITLCSKVLTNSDVTLMPTYFEISLQNVKKGDLVYLDPPYVGSFANYTKTGFNMDKQEALALEYERLSKLGAKVLLSNSDHSWVRERFSEFNIIEIFTKKSVSCSGKDRSTVVKELLMRNF